MMAKSSVHGRRCAPIVTSVFAVLVTHAGLAAADQPPATPGGSEPPTAAKPAEAEAGAPASRTTHTGSLDTLAAGSMQQVRVGSLRGRYAMNIFGDVDFFAGTSNSASLPGGPPGTHPSFALGSLSFLITGELEKHFVSTAEFAMEYDDKSNTVGIDIERLHVGWLGEHFFIYAGRVHTAFGYWSNAYHHGKWLQPNMERPRWVAFEDSGGLLPIHTVGLSGGPIIDVGQSKVKITASVSNGRGNVIDDIRNTFDYQAAKALHLQAEYIGLGLPELRVGISGMYDRIAPADATIRPALPDTHIDEYILGAHVAYPGYPVLLIAEGYYVVHIAANHWYRTYGGFVTFAHSFGPVTPYVRGQWIGTLGGSDPFFVPKGPESGAAPIEELEWIGGVRFDLTDWTAVRAEYRATKLGDGDVAQQGVLQWAWGF
jgi:hypothetical protein